MKNSKLIKIISAACLTACALIFAQTSVKAEYVRDETNSTYYDDEVRIDAGYAYSYSGGAGGYCDVYLGNKGDRVSNIKSSSSKLLAKKTRERVCKKTSSDYDYETWEMLTTTSTSYTSSYVAFFSNKPGTYSVSFDVVDVTGHVRCSKTIKVIVTGTTSYTSPIKSVKFAGKEIWEYYPYSTKKSGKLSVSLKRGYSLVSIEVEKKNKKGEYVTTKMKNNKTLKLATSCKYTYTSDSYSRVRNSLFPETNIIVTVKNKKTKQTYQYYYSLYTLNTK